MERMDDAAVTQLANDLLLEIVKGIKFPRYVRLLEDRDELTFFIIIPSTVGKATVVYQPLGAAEYLVRECEKVMGPVVEPFPEMIRKEFIRTSSAAAISTLLNTFHHEFVETTFDLPTLSLVTFAGFAAELKERSRAKLEGGAPGRAHEKQVDELLAQLNRSRRERMLAAVHDARARSQPAWRMLPIFYDSLLSVWKEAKKIYRTNRDGRWREFISVLSSDDPLPSDLVERLDSGGSDKDSYESMPSSLALEHAARLCGVSPNSYKLRTLQEHLAENRKWFDTAGESEREEATQAFTSEQLLQRELNKIVRESLNTAEDESSPPQ